MTSDAVVNRRDIIRRIVERDGHKKSLAESLVARDEPDLHAAACEHFGTWNTALTYAGIRLNARHPRRGNRQSPRKPEPGSADHVLRTIRQLSNKGYNLHEARVERRDRTLVDAAKQHFGSWRAAVVEATVRRQAAETADVAWTDEQVRVMQRLQERHRTGRPLDWRDVVCNDPQLASAVGSAFASWQEALQAAKLPVSKHSYRFWSPEIVVVAIQRRHAQGLSLKPADVMRDGIALYSAARRHWGGWHAAVQAAGLDDRGANEVVS